MLINIVIPNVQIKQNRNNFTSFKLFLTIFFTSDK
nr:MAG TPA: hypothetical protein [Inoviridae sp.]